MTILDALCLSGMDGKIDIIAGFIRQKYAQISDSFNQLYLVVREPFDTC